MPDAFRLLARACALAAALALPRLVTAGVTASPGGTAAAASPATPDLRLALPVLFTSTPPEPSAATPLQRALRDELHRLEAASGIDTDRAPELPESSALSAPPCPRGGDCHATRDATATAPRAPPQALPVTGTSLVVNTPGTESSRAHLLHLVPALSWHMVRDEGLTLLYGGAPSAEDLLMRAGPSSSDAVARAASRFQPILPQWTVFATAGAALAAAGGGLLLSAGPGDLWAGLDRAGRSSGGRTGAAEAGADPTRELRSRQRGADALFVSTGALVAAIGVEAPLAGLLGYHASVGWSAFGAVLRLDASF